MSLQPATLAPGLNLVDARQVYMSCCPTRSSCLVCIQDAAPLHSTASVVPLSDLAVDDRATSAPLRPRVSSAFRLPVVCLCSIAARFD